MKNTKKRSKRIIAYLLALALLVSSTDIMAAQEENGDNAGLILQEEVYENEMAPISQDEVFEENESLSSSQDEAIAENGSFSPSSAGEVSSEEDALEDETATEEIITDQTEQDVDDESGEESGGFRMVPGENDIESTVISYGNGPKLLRAEALPAKYITPELPDLRSQFKSTCWAHATMALAEINLMNKNIYEEPDLSELHTVWFSYHSVTDPLGGTAEDSNGVPSGTNILTIGGNPVFSQNVLACWTGAADEEVLKSSDATSVQNKILVPDDELAYLDKAHLTHIYEVNLKEDPEGAKRLIRDQGAIAVSYYSASSSSPLTDAGTYNSDTGAYYDKSTHGGRQNHAVVIVGWDDDFSKDNFATKPEGDGAWLIRNSWTAGSSSEGIENPSYAGYFWMSYENASLAAGARAFELEAEDNYAHNYQYDGAMYRKGWTPDSYSEDELKTANIFTAKACENGELIRAAAFQTSSANLEYTIDIYTQLSDLSNPESGRKVTEASASGTTVYPGYYTVPLPAPAYVSAGQSFSVVVTLKKSGAVPTIGREISWSGWATIKAGLQPGQSLYYDGGWKDVEDSIGGNLVIKAFTDDIPEDAVFIPEALDFEDGLSVIGLTVSPGFKKTLRINFTPYYVSDRTVTWYSSDPGIAIVDENGVLTGMSEGSCVITAVSNAAPTVSNSFTVTVRKEDKWHTDPVKEADEATRAALAEDLSITGEGEGGSLTDAQVYEILARVSDVDDAGNHTYKLWVGGIDDSERAYVYTGAAIRPAVHVYDGIKLLKEKRDYTLSYANNKNAGQARIKIQFKGNYAATSKVVYFTIAPAELGNDITADEIVLNPKKQNAVQKPIPVLRNAETGAQITFKTSVFTLTYASEEEPEVLLKGVTAPGRYIAHITAKTKTVQNYLGDISIPILVTTDQMPISKVSVSIEKKSYIYTGDKIVPKLVITDTTRNDTLRESIDYDLDVRNNILPGKAVVLIRGTGIRYSGVRSVTFQIKKGKRADSESIHIEYEHSLPYLKGGAVPAVTVTDDGKRLTEGTDYTITCEGNRKITQNAVLKVKFKGCYTGTFTGYYSIVKKDISILQDEMTAADTVLTAKADSYKKTVITLTDTDGKKLTTADYEIAGFKNAVDGSDMTSPGIGDRIIVTVRGIGGYEGEASAEYALISSSMKLSVAKQTKKLPAVYYTGEAAVLPDRAFEGLLTSSSGKVLVPGEDFEIVGYMNNNGQGTGKVILHGIPKTDGTGYGGFLTIPFTIKARNIEIFNIFSKRESGYI